MAQPLLDSVTNELKEIASLVNVTELSEGEREKLGVGSTPTVAASRIPLPPSSRMDRNRTLSQLLRQPMHSPRVWTRLRRPPSSKAAQAHRRPEASCPAPGTPLRERSPRCSSRSGTSSQAWRPSVSGRSRARLVAVCWALARPALRSSSPNVESVLPSAPRRWPWMSGGATPPPDHRPGRLMARDAPALDFPHRSQHRPPRLASLIVTSNRLVQRPGRNLRRPVHCHRDDRPPRHHAEILPLKGDVTASKTVTSPTPRRSKTDLSY
jgi:hypothetical protein